MYRKYAGFSDASFHADCKFGIVFSHEERVHDKKSTFLTYI